MNNTDLVQRDAPFPTWASWADRKDDNAIQYAVRVIGDKEAEVRAWVSWSPPAPGLVSNDPDGPLAGIPFGVKDVIDVQGFPTRCGSSASDERPAAFNAACVEALVGAGAVPIGKTVTAEYAFRHPGPTHNPHKLNHTPGGSSSGSAAAVAAGMVPLAISTQTGGSIIRPAAYCGVPALKPSFGLVNRSGLKLTCDSLDTIGWHGSDVDWVKRCADVLLPRKSTLPGASAHGLKVAVIGTVPDEALTPGGRKALHRAVSALRAIGADCEPLNLDRQLKLLSQAHAVIMKYEFARNLGPVVRKQKQGLSDVLLNNVAEGLAVPSSLYLEMLQVQHEMRTQWHSISGGADLIITPSAAGPAPEGHAFTGTPAFNKCWTVLGWPCLHIPVLNDEHGLPTGVQLIGPWHDDFQVLNYGLELENTLPLNLTTYPPI